MNPYEPQNTQSLAQAEQLIQQLMQQTQQASGQYQQLLKQEQENAALLQQIAQREQQAAHIIQTALQGHQTAMQQLQQISGICNQISNSSHQASLHMNANQAQTSGFSPYAQH